MNNLNCKEIKFKLKQSKGSNVLLLQTSYEDGDDIENDIFDVPIVMNVANSNPGNIFDAFRRVSDKNNT